MKFISALSFIFLVSNISIAASKITIFESFGGYWGWASKDSKVNCKSNPHTITFSKDKKKAYLRLREPTIALDGKRKQKLVYTIQSFTSKSITMKLDDEFRKDNNGNLIVWDIILVSKNKYVWRRNDWLPGMFTPFNVRCNLHITKH